MECHWCLEDSLELMNLSCEHTFCERCLRELWAPENTGDCPRCKRKSSKQLPVEFTLKTPEEQTREKEQSPESAEPGVSGLEEELREGRQKRIKEMMKEHRVMLEHMEEQTLHCETQIRAQFDLFHQFLKQEEEFHLSALREEHKTKTRIIEEELKKLEDGLNALMEDQDRSSLSEDMENLELTDEPQLRSGLLLDQAAVLGNLGYRVWERMGTTVTYNAVILDPNTAHGKLRLSEDLTCVRKESTFKQVPQNPERYSYYSSVIGSEGFSSGWHCWDVEVGDHPDWTIGLVKESAERRARCGTFPEDGFWCLMHRDGRFTDVNGEDLKLRKRPEKICVVLNYDTGRLSFYANEDFSLICSYLDTFSDRLFPYFSVGRSGDANVTKEIKICPSDATFGTAVERGTGPRISEEMLQNVPLSTLESALNNFLTSSFYDPLSASEI